MRCFVLGGYTYFSNLSFFLKVGCLLLLLRFSFSLLLDTIFLLFFLRVYLKTISVFFFQTFHFLCFLFSWHALLVYVCFQAVSFLFIKGQIFARGRPIIFLGRPFFILYGLNACDFSLKGRLQIIYQTMS